MDAIIKSHMMQGLRGGRELDKHAASLCALMTTPPADPHEAEVYFKIAKEGDFNFLISAHHRQVRAVYSHVFIGSQPGRVRGRYQFYLLPMPHEIVSSMPSSLLTILIDTSGLFSVGGNELLCDPPAIQRSLMRNLITTYVIAALQKGVTVQVPE